MSPSRTTDPNVGLILGFGGTCPTCSFPVAEPVTCSGCGRYGHPQCLRAEWFQGLPFCATCLRAVILDYSAREDRRRREEWRDYHLQQLQRWKQIALNAVGVTSAVGVAIGGTTAVVAGAAAGFARGAVVAAMGARNTATGALMDQQLVEATVPAVVDQTPTESPQAALVAPQATPQLADRSSETTPSASALAVTPPPAPVGSRVRSRSAEPLRLVTRAQLEAAGHCTACHEGAHRAHIGWGDCRAVPRLERWRIPDAPEPRESPAAPQTNARSPPPTAPQTNARTPPTTVPLPPTARIPPLPPTVPLQPTTSDGRIHEDFRSAASAGGPDEAMIAALSAEIGLPNATGSPPRELQELASIPGSQSQGQPMPSTLSALRPLLPPQVGADVLHELLLRLDRLETAVTKLDDKMSTVIDDIAAIGNRVDVLEVTVKSWEDYNPKEYGTQAFDMASGGTTPRAEAGTSDPQQEWLNDQLVDLLGLEEPMVAGPPQTMGHCGPGLRPPLSHAPPQVRIVEAPGDGQTTSMGAEGWAAMGATSMNSLAHFGGSAPGSDLPRSFDDVFTFIGASAAPSSGIAHEPGGPTIWPTRARQLDSAAIPVAAPGLEQHALVDLGVPTPEEPLSTSELNFIMKAIQGLVGEFPTVELGGIAERPEVLRKWRYATQTALEAAGPQVTTWWTSCWQAAEEAHSLYMKAPVMNREGLRVERRPKAKYALIESWIKPRLVTAMPQGIKKQIAARGAQGMRDEVCDVLYLLLKTCCSGAADEKQAVLRQLQNPTPCSKPESALNELQRFWAASRRCHQLGMSFPDLTVLYTALRSIFRVLRAR